MDVVNLDNNAKITIENIENTVIEEYIFVKSDAFTAHSSKNKRK